MGWTQHHGYWVLQQNDQLTCGYCCVGMVVNLIDGSKPSENSLKYGSGTKGNRGQAAMDMANAKAMEIHNPHATTNSLDGTYGNHLAHVLFKNYRINAEYGEKSVRDVMRSATPSAPLIVLVKWGIRGDGAGHWVVVAKRKTQGKGKDSDYIILDPWNGKATKNIGSRQYKPKYNNGWFSNYYVKINGYR